MKDSSGLKAKRALQPESAMYFIETLSAVILMNSNFLKKNAAQIILLLPRSWSQETAYSTKLFRKIVGFKCTEGVDVGVYSLPP